MKDDATEEGGDVHSFALTKMSNVLGEHRARTLLDGLLREHHLQLRSPEDLMRLSEAMSTLRGFEAAVGAMLGVAAVMRGATPIRKVG